MHSLVHISDGCFGTLQQQLAALFGFLQCASRLHETQLLTDVFDFAFDDQHQMLRVGALHNVRRTQTETVHGRYAGFVVVDNDDRHAWCQCDKLRQNL